MAVSLTRSLPVDSQPTAAALGAELKAIEEYWDSPGSPEDYTPEADAQMNELMRAIVKTPAVSLEDVAYKVIEAAGMVLSAYLPNGDYDVAQWLRTASHSDLDRLLNDDGALPFDDGILISAALDLRNLTR